MTDFLFNLIWTICVAMAMMLAELIASRLVMLRRVVAAVKRIVDQPLPEAVIVEKVRVQLDAMDSLTAPVWGAELSAVALSLDFAALGIWISDPSVFPFFERWNDEEVQREVPLWLVVFLIHFIALLFSIIFRQLYGEGRQIFSSIAPSWIYRNRWMLAANTVGFFSLLSTFTILTNAL